MSKTYYCPISNTTNWHYLRDDLHMKEYSFWKNAGFLASIMIVGGFLSFILTYVFHEMKLCGAKPFQPEKADATEEDRAAIDKATMKSIVKPSSLH